MRNAVIVLIVWVAVEAAAHKLDITRTIAVQAEPDGAAVLLVALEIPRAERAAAWRRAWDRDANKSVDAGEAMAGAKEIAATALADVVIEGDRRAAECTIEVNERGIVGAVDDAPFAIAVLVECAAAREWIVYAGGRVETTLRFVRPPHPASLRSATLSRKGRGETSPSPLAGEGNVERSETEGEGCVVSDERFLAWIACP